MLYLLIRSISSYSGYSMIIGAYKTKEEVSCAKDNVISEFTKSDPFAIQGYHKVGNDFDLYISEFDDTDAKIKDGNIYILVERLDGQGLFIVDIQRLIKEDEDIKKLLDSENSRKGDFDGILTYYKVKIGRTKIQDSLVYFDYETFDDERRSIYPKISV